MDNSGGNEDRSYQISEMLTLFTNGGVFLYDEIDAADSNMILVVNDLLALRPGETFHNPVNGQQYVKSPDFIPIAGANTLGLGASREFTGRERLDGATLDRFRMGRVTLDLDRDLLRSIIGLS
jgi:hypothetical protein